MFFMIIAGTIGSDATVRHLDGGSAAISFSLAHSEKWKDRTGQVQERTTWVKVTLWRKSDNIGVVPYLTKGTKVTVQGTPKVSAWLKDGQAKGELECTAQDVVLQGAPASGRVQDQDQPKENAVTPSNSFNQFANQDNDDLPF